MIDTKQSTGVDRLEFVDGELSDDDTSTNGLLTTFHTQWSRWLGPITGVKGNGIANGTTADREQQWATRVGQDGEIRVLPSFYTLR